MTNSAVQARSVRSMPSMLPRPSRGFTLIEMIAAFVIFALAVGALMQILTLSMNNARRSADETRAALWAQSSLDTVGIGERIEAGSSHGEFDDKYHWEMEIEQIDPELVVADVAQPAAGIGNNPSALAAQAQGFQQSSQAVFGMPQIDLFHVALTVIWGDNRHERSAKFTTLRTATTDETKSQSFSSGDLRGQQQGAPPAMTRQPSPKPSPSGRR